MRVITPQSADVALTFPASTMAFLRALSHKKTRMPFSRRPTACLFEKLYGKCTPDFTHPAKILCVGVVDMHYFDLDLGTHTQPRYGSDLPAC